MKNKIFLLILFLITFNSFSQDNEIGVFIGGTNYIGDIGPSTYIDPFKYDGSRWKILETIGTETTFYALGILYRKNFNNRIAARAQLNYSNIGSKDKLPGSEKFRKERGKEFINTITEFSLGIDFNFFPFDLREDNFQWTPYIHSGITYLKFNALHYPIGINSATKYENDSSFAIPITLGLKVKPLRDFVIGFEVSAKHTFTDNLDGSNPKYKNMELYSQKAFGSDLSQDWYVFTGFTLTYIFGFEPCYCPK